MAERRGSTGSAEAVTSPIASPTNAAAVTTPTAAAGSGGAAVAAVGTGGEFRGPSQALSTASAVVGGSSGGSALSAAAVRSPTFLTALQPSSDAELVAAADASTDAAQAKALLEKQRFLHMELTIQCFYH